MVTMKRIAVLLLAGALAFPSQVWPEIATGPTSSSLFAQAVARSLDRNFPDGDISFLLFDVHSGQLLASRWDRPDYPIPLGSLLKPFAALAYGEQHTFRYPAHICRGSASGCWRPSGHGRVDLTSAIAYSCNSYFRALTADLTSAEMFTISSRYGLDAPGASLAGVDFAGLTPRWKISPMRMARAYLHLIRESQDPIVREILTGMADSGSRGTGAEVDRALVASSALVKTGTAACTHEHHAPGDGFAVALEPADAPRILLFVRVHGIPGSHAARTAGEMLHSIQE